MNYTQQVFKLHDNILQDGYRFITNPARFLFTKKSERLVMTNNKKSAETKQTVKRVAKTTKDNTKKVVKNSVHDLKHGASGIEPKK